LSGKICRRLRKLLLGVTALVALSLLLRAAHFDGPILPREAPPRGGILDIHCHTAGLGGGSSGCFVSAALRASYKLRAYLAAVSVSEEELEEHGDQLVIRRIAAGIAASSMVSAAVVLALDGVVGPDGELDRANTELYVPNEFVAREVATEDGLFFGASINPYRRDALERLQWAADQGAVLVKWIPSIQWIDPGDERLLPFYRTMRELRLPLLTHAGQERSFTRAKDELADPARLHLPLEQGVLVIAAHAAATGSNEGEDNVDRLVRLMERYPNLYTDISSLTQINKLGYLREVLREPRVRSRLLYGSDYPLTATLLVSPWYFPLNLSVREIRTIGALSSVWDRDVALKQALGVPASVFARSADLLGVAVQ
jgi:predicted TIM-barrel fold metal-dependent hydrolase